MTAASKGIHILFYHAAALSPVVALSSLIRIWPAEVCSESSREMGPPPPSFSSLTVAPS